VPAKVASRPYVYEGNELPAVNCSASIDGAGVMHVSLSNIDPDAPSRVSVKLDHFLAKSAEGQVLASKEMNAHNTFDHPDEVKPGAFTAFELGNGSITVELPPMSVVVLAVKGDVKLEPRAAVKVKNPAPGLAYSYYFIDGERMPNFATLTPKSTGSVATVAFPKEVRDSDFGLLYDGYVKIAEAGVYTFFTTSDDGTVMFIDGKMVVNNDGRHGAIEKSGFVQLDAGYHTMKILFFQGGGGYEIGAAIKGPGMEKQEIPTSMLFHEK